MMKAFLLALVLTACSAEAPPPAALVAPAAPKPTAIDTTRKDLVFRYLDPTTGEVATATTVDAIPAPAKAQVVVYDPTAEVPAGWDLVVDLTRDLTQGTIAIPRQNFAFATRSAATPSTEKPTTATNKNAQHEVVMFSTEGCGYCSKARSFLTQQRIPFSELDLEEDPAARGRLSALGKRAGLGPNDLQGVPIIFVDGTPILGWDQRRLSSLLGLGG